MSVRLMSAIWDMEFSPVEKLILLAVADWANDEGLAWPSIAQLAKKTGCGERTVQRTLRAAEQSGLLKRHENPGKGCSYRIDPRHAGTPVTAAPVPETTPTPATLAPNTPVYTSSQKATPSSKKRAPKAPAFILPSDIPELEWTAFDQMRRRIGKPMTDHARDLAINRLRKLAADGWPPGDVLNHSTLNNYQGLFPPKDDNHGQRNGNHRNGQSATGFGPTIDAAARFAAREGHH
jgi:hypothetical protein